MRLLLGGQVVIGTPTQASAFFERNWDAWTDEAWAALSVREYAKKSKAPEREAEYHRRVDPVADTLRAIREGGEQDEPVLTLVHAEWLPNQGDGLRIPAVRVPVSAVQGWWIGGAERISAGGSWFFGVGAVVPLDGS